uniref:beta-ketoacyl reductase n=1 Tax=Burkholderia sp. Ac-20379 TaxID=2703900 RepID=UPI00198153FC
RGGRVICEAADASDARAAEQLVDGIRRRFGRLDGVVHAAGQLDDGALLQKVPARVAGVLAPKVAGVVNLDRALGTAPLDFFVLFASIAGALGNPGQADYAAANAFLDDFAAVREARRRAGRCHGRTVAIDWPLWQDGGMQLDAATLTLMKKTAGLTPLATRTGLAALSAIVAGDAPQVLVLTGDPARLRERILAAPALPRFVSESASASASAPAAVTQAQVAPAAAVDTGELRQRVLAALMRAVAQQLKVPLEDLSADTELSEYGFDSISFTQFANALNDRFDLDATPTLFFEYPTLDELASYCVNEHGAAMAERLGVAPAAPAVPVASPAEPAAAPVAAAFVVAPAAPA